MKVLEKTDMRLIVQQTNGLFPIMFGLVFMLTGVGTFFLLAQTRTISCVRVETQLIQCDIASSFMGLPLNTRSVHGFQFAYIQENVDSEGDSTYQVFLTGRDGDTPLTSYASSGYGEKQAVIDDLNLFAANTTENNVTIHDQPGFFNYLFGLVFVGIGLTILFFGLQRHSYTLDRGENSFVYLRKGVFGSKSWSFALDEIAEVHVEQNDNTFRPVVTLSDGEKVPLTGMFSSGRSGKDELVRIICEFIDQDSSSTINY